MPSLILGPVLRHVGARSDSCWATLWVEVDRRCRVRVGCDSGPTGEAWTFEVEGHFYALVQVEGLDPDAVTGYSVHLDDGLVWPPAEAPLTGAPASVIRTPPSHGPRRLAFGSCRVASPPDAGPPAQDPLGVDALDAYAVRAASSPPEALPDLLLMLGDQVYADETSDETRRRIAQRRGPDPGLGKRGMFRRGHLGADLEHPPGAQVADFEEYTWLYKESWGDGPIRWLFSTVPVGMIFDDHDVHDDWNTSAAWRRDMQDLRWWQNRIVGGLMSYWVYQHIGNLSPDELAADAMYQQVLGLAETGDDAGPVLREFAAAADAAVGDTHGGYRWSFWRDLGPLRLVVLDSRCGRVLVDGDRSMLAEATFDWLEQRLDGDYRHLALGTSLPWLLNPALQALEGWNERLGDRPGRLRPGLGEQIRRGLDLEHWAAFGAAFERLADVLRRTSAGRGSSPAPATISVLSGDVHHSYVSRVDLGSGRSGTPGTGSSRVYQLTCSPVHNMLPASMQRAFRLIWRPTATRLTDALFHRLLRVPRLTVDWHTLDGPFFDNCIATLELTEDRATVTLEASRVDAAGHLTLHPVATRTL